MLRLLLLPRLVALPFDQLGDAQVAAEGGVERGTIQEIPLDNLRRRANSALQDLRPARQAAHWPARGFEAMQESTAYVTRRAGKQDELVAALCYGHRPGQVSATRTSSNLLGLSTANGTTVQHFDKCNLRQRVCRQLRLTGATGLEPAASGVTGRSDPDDG